MDISIKQKLQEPVTTFDWSGDQPIEKLESDIKELKKKNVTHVNIKVETDYSDYSYVVFSAFKERLETDKEFKTRIENEKRRIHRTKQSILFRQHQLEEELERLNKLK